MLYTNCINIKIMILNNDNSKRLFIYFGIKDTLLPEYT